MLGHDLGCGIALQSEIRTGSAQVRTECYGYLTAAAARAAPAAGARTKDSTYQILRATREPNRTSLRDGRMWAPQCHKGSGRPKAGGSL